ncbi:MAG: hypothetical protein ABI378_01035 [Chitinophagaceae bacterium]
MKILSCLAFLLSISCSAMAQDDATVDLLQTPYSPAANLIGTSPSDVQAFTDPSAFALSIQQASKNLSSFPGNYAVDIAPAWLFFGKNISYKSFTEPDKKSNIAAHIWQSLVISAATRSADSATEGTGIGLAFKCSIVRGKLLPTTLQQSDATLDLLRKVHAVIEEEVDEAKATEAYQKADEAGDTQTQMDIINAAQIRGESKAVEARKALENAVKAINFKRYGFKLDLAGGLSFRFPNDIFEKGRINKSGLWLTLGYETPKGFTAVGIVRYLYNDNQLFADENELIHVGDLATLDAGARIIYAAPQSKFAASFEGVYRSVVSRTDVATTWRATLNLEYDVSINKKISFALGRDFDGSFQKEGNLIAALNLILGFGNKRFKSN